MKNIFSKRSDSLWSVVYFSSSHTIKNGGIQGLVISEVIDNCGSPISYSLESLYLKRVVQELRKEEVHLLARRLECMLFVMTIFCR